MVITGDEVELNRIKNNSETIIQRLNTEHNSLINQKEIEKQQALLELEKKYQEQIAQLHEAHNNKITELYERLDLQRETNQKKNNKNKTLIDGFFQFIWLSTNTFYSSCYLLTY